MKIDPTRLYIDTRLGYDPSIDKNALQGIKWLERGTDEKWLVPVVVNPNGYLMQLPRD